MTNTQAHPTKRVITFIMALLMFVSSFINYMAIPSNAELVTVGIQLNISECTSTNLQYSGWNTSVSGWAQAVTFQGNTAGRGLKATLDSCGDSAAYNDMFVPNFSRTGYTFAGTYTVVRIRNLAVNATYTGMGATGSANYLYSEANDIYQCTPEWIANTYTITYHSDRTASADTKVQTFEYGVKEALEPNTFTAPVGKKFSHWENTSGNTTYTDGQSVQSLTSNNGANVNLYAVWEDIGYTLTLNGNGGTINGSATKSYPIVFGQTYKSAFGGTFPTPVRTGYTFGYYDYQGFHLNTDNWDTATYAIPSNGTMNAVWTANTYTVNYNANGGTGTTASSSHTYDTAKALTANGFSRSGYTFLGWSTSSTATTATYSNGQSVKNLTDTNGGTVTLYAVWQQSSVTTTIKFHLNGGSASGLSETTTITYVTNSAQDMYWTDIYNYGSNKATLDKLFAATKSGYVLNYYMYTVPDAGGDGIGYSALDPDDGAYIRAEYAGTTIELTAQWTPTATYTLTFDLDGGTLSNKYNLDNNYQVKIAKGDYYANVVGGFPVPTKVGCEFAGWKYTDANGTEYLWEKSWDKYPTYGLDSDGTLTAYWVQNSVDVIFNAIGFEQTYDYYNNDEYVPVLMENTDPATVNGTGKTVTLKLFPGDSFSKAPGYQNCPIPTYSGWKFAGWYTAWVDPATGENRQEIISAEDWSTSTYNGVATIYYALYFCDHSAGLTWHYSDSTTTHVNPLTPDFYLDGADPWDDGTKSHAGFFRHHGVCKNCGNLAAFGYDVHFLARNNYGSDILLSAGVPTEDLFTVTGGTLLATPVGTIVVDMLGDGLDPELTIKFNPVIKAAKTDDHFVAWEVDLRKWGYRDANHKNYPIYFTDDTKTITYKFDHKDMDTEGGLHSSHLRLIAGYDEDYREMVFDSGVLMPYQDNPLLTDGVESPTTINCEIVDSGIRYGVLPIKEGDFFTDVIDYIPTGKQVVNYNGALITYTYLQKGNNGYENRYIRYSNFHNTLYCTVGWVKRGDPTNTNNGADLLNSSTWQAQYAYTGDVVFDSFFFAASDRTSDEQQDYSNDGIADGFLITMYANNKKSGDDEIDEYNSDYIKGNVETDYNKAYFDPNERSGGTMYYRYFKNASNEWECEPLFHYDPLTDYKDSAIKCYSSDYRNDAEYAAVKAAGNLVCEVRFDPEKDFSYLDHISHIQGSHTSIIAKEPKRYTYYIGEGASYVFPIPVNAPDGTPYTGSFSFGNGSTVKEPDLTDKEMSINTHTEETDNKVYSYGDTFYNDVYIDDANETQGKFRLARNSDGFPVANIYTIFASFDNFGVDGTLPLGLPRGSYTTIKDVTYKKYYSPTGQDVTGRDVYETGTATSYTGVFPYGNKNAAFFTDRSYEDYGLTYGDGIALNYPEGQGITKYGQAAASDAPSAAKLYSEAGMKYKDLQACFYLQWDYLYEYRSEFPNGQDASDENDLVVGYPYAAKEQIEEDYNTTDASSIFNGMNKYGTNNNYFVYDYFNVFAVSPTHTNKMFTCDDYIITKWQLFSKDAPNTPLYTIDAITNWVDYYAYTEMWYNFDGYVNDVNPTGFNSKNYQFDIFKITTLAKEPGKYYLAPVWEKAINYTLVDGNSGYGDTPFANIGYTDAYTNNTKTINITDTTTVKTVFGSTVSVKNVNSSRFPNSVLAYFTINNMYKNGTADNKLIADRILTTKNSYSFTIVADTAMTAQFVESGTTDAMYLDRNNKLLEGTDSTWVLYDDSDDPRVALGYNGSGSNSIYREYTESTTAYSVKVTGSTYSKMNATHTLNYDETITLMTAPVNSSGAKFIGWKSTDSEKTSGDEYISYDPVFKYRVVSSETEVITAVYGTATPVPNISIEHSADNYSSNGNDYFIARYAAPEGYELIESGFVYSRNKSLTAEEANINNPDYFRVVTTDQHNDGVFKLLLVNSGTNYVFAYVYYRDPDGNVKCYITPRVNK